MYLSAFGERNFSREDINEQVKRRKRTGDNFRVVNSVEKLKLNGGGRGRTLAGGWESAFNEENEADSATPRSRKAFKAEAAVGTKKALLQGDAQQWEEGQWKQSR